MKQELEAANRDKAAEVFESEKPWMHTPESYSIAITGKAFNKLCSDPKQKGVLQ